MSRYAIILCVLAGCSTTTAIPAPGTYTPLVASVAGLVSASDGTPTPEPPKPAPGICENCKGTGKLGDGTITVNCPVCGGDGRTDNELPKVEPKPVAVPRVDPVPKLESYQDAVKAFDESCTNGQCNQPTTNVRQPAANIQESQPVRRGLFGRRRGG